MTEIELSGQTYQIRKLDAFKQFHLSRKIAPLLPKLAPAFMGLAGLNDKADFTQTLQSFTPFAEALAEMSEEASEQVMVLALSAVLRKSGSGWAPVIAQGKAALMFDDMDLGTIIKLVIQVIGANIGPFLEGLLTAQMQPMETASA